MPKSVSPIVLLNPIAGQGRARRLRGAVSERLRRLGSGARLVETEEPGHAEELARQAAADGHDRVIVVGGDGTVQEAVNGLLRGSPAAREPLPVGIVPGGSGNDLVRALGLPRGDGPALEVALDGGQRVIDVVEARAGDRARRYVSAAGAGFDAQVAAAMSGKRHVWQRGTVGYLVSALLELRRYDNRALRITLRGPDGDREIARRALMVAVTNGAYYGGGFWICPEARTDDGLLDVCVVGDVSRFEALKQLPGVYRGRHVNHPAVEFHRAREVVLEAESPTRLHLDGELFGELPVTLTVQPGAIRVAATALSPEPQIG